MTKTLILYDGKMGSAERIAGKLAYVIGHTLLRELDEAPEDLGAFDGFCFVFNFYGAVTAGRAKIFLTSHREELEHARIAFVGVGYSELGFSKYIVSVETESGVEGISGFFISNENQTMRCGYEIGNMMHVPVRPMPDDMLYREIERYVVNHNTLALATSADGYVRCTPLEYIFIDHAFYIITEGGNKFRGILENGNVSAAVFDEFTDMADLTGLQFRGIAKLVPEESAEYQAIMEAKSISDEARANLGVGLYVIRIEPMKYEFLNSDFKNRGYDTHQELSTIFLQESYEKAAEYAQKGPEEMVVRPEVGNLITDAPLLKAVRPEAQDEGADALDEEEEEDSPGGEFDAENGEDAGEPDEDEPGSSFLKNRYGRLFDDVKPEEELDLDKEFEGLDEEESETEDSPDEEAELFRENWEDDEAEPEEKDGAERTEQGRGFGSLKESIFGMLKKFGGEEEPVPGDEDAEESYDEEESCDEEESYDAGESYDAEESYDAGETDETGEAADRLTDAERPKDIPKAVQEALAADAARELAENVSDIVKGPEKKEPSPKPEFDILDEITSELPEEEEAPESTGEDPDEYEDDEYEDNYDDPDEDEDEDEEFDFDFSGTEFEEAQEEAGEEEFEASMRPVRKPSSGKKSGGSFFDGVKKFFGNIVKETPDEPARTEKRRSKSSQDDMELSRLSDYDADYGDEYDPDVDDEYDDFDMNDLRDDYGPETDFDTFEEYDE